MAHWPRRCLAKREPQSPLLPQSRHAQCADGQLEGMQRYLYSPPTWGVDGKVLDAGLLNWLWVELHKLHDLYRHPYFYRKAERSRFAGGQRIVMRPISAC